MKCHYTYDEEGNKILIPGCMGTAAMGIEHCTCRKVEFYRVKPIHLTEELLLKCGFKEKTHGFCKGGV